MDFTDLKERIDLLAEVEKDLGPGHRSGRWVMFSCPFPGHKHGDADPSLAVTPSNGRYFCFTCGKSGDLITWLRDRRGMSWAEINDLAGSDHLPASNPRMADQLQHEITAPPCQEWQSRGWSFISAWQEALWSKRGKRALDYLHDRGLADETIRFYKLGFNLEDKWDDRQLWSFPEDPQAKRIRLPRGITIPCLITSDWTCSELKTVWYIKIRQPKGEPKYLNITGGRGALFGADNLVVAGNGSKVGLLCEGEFDAILAAQELPEIGAATLGSAAKHLDLSLWGAYFLPLRWLLSAYDTDRPGQAGAAALQDLLTIHPLQVPCLSPGDKDLTDYHRSGGDLWAWLRYNLDRIEAVDQILASSICAGLPVDGGR
jgi:DNA primase